MSPNKKASITLRAKPIKPTRRFIQQSESLGSHAKLAEILAKLPPDYDPNRISVKVERDYYEYSCDSSCYLSLTYYKPQDEEDFQAEMEHYRQKLAKWERWYAKNRGVIEAEEARRAKEKQEKQAREKERREKSRERYLLQQKARLEKELQRTQQLIQKRLKKQNE